MVTKELCEFFEKNEKVALGFSGGVDSSYLLYVGKKCSANIQPYFVKTSFQPEFELEDAKLLAESLDVDLKIIYLDVLSDEIIANNPEDRCYYCKNLILSNLIRAAKKDGYEVVIDGTNASDDIGDRPGIKALRELEVRSPLREAGLTKDKIREYSKEAGLFTWDKPAYSCLATRVFTGKKITNEILEKVEKAEERLFELGYTDFRVRVIDDMARVQVKEFEMERFVKDRKKILEVLKPHFDIILLDMEGR